MKKCYLLGLLLVILACEKPEKNLKYGAISSASPEATTAGMHILKAGGNAVDAAIAISFALGVSEPAMSGIGGGTQVQIYLPQYAKPFTINGSTFSPAATPLGFVKDSLQGHLRTTIPSTVKVMQYLYDTYGSKKLKWQELLQPAIETAENGFILGPFRKKVYERYENKLANGMPYTSEYYPLSADQNQPQLKMAQTLKLIAQEGAAAFYTGKIASSIDKDMKAHEGWITKEDLARFPIPDSLESIHFKHNGFDIYTQPKPCGGWVVKEILEKLTRLRTDDNNGNEILLMIEAIHFGHEQRQLSAKEIANEPSGETTHFSVIDKNGIVVSVTSSINAYYGAGVANPEYGFLYNSYMDDFNFDEVGNIYAVGPSKMAYSSMSPTIVMKEGRVVLIIGSPGSARIISTVAQLIDTYTKGFSQSEKLLAIPRVHAINEKVYFEKDEQHILFDTTENRDWKIVQPSSHLVQNGLNAYFGGVHAIVWTGTEYKALADPRRDGLAVTD